MTYTYVCEECGKETEVICPMSEMKRTITCPHCSKTAYKKIESPFIMGGSSSNASFKKEMTKRNDEAGKRMRGSHKSVRIKPNE